MVRARFCLLLIAVALLLPLAAGADTCATCLADDSSGCCPPACALCLCCGAVTELSSLPRVDRGLTLALAAGEPAGERRSSFDPRDIFHVPKPA